MERRSALSRWLHPIQKSCLPLAQVTRSLAAITLSDYPEAAKRCHGYWLTTYGDLNTELIVSLKPDLVLAAEINTPEQVKALEDLGLTVYYLKNPITLEEMYVNIEIVAQLTGQGSHKVNRFAQGARGRRG